MHLLFDLPATFASVSPSSNINNAPKTVQKIKHVAIFRLLALRSSGARDRFHDLMAIVQMRSQPAVHRLVNECYDSFSRLKALMALLTSADANCGGPSSPAHVHWLFPKDSS